VSQVPGLISRDEIFGSTYLIRAHERNRQTDRQTHRITMSISRYAL